MVLTIEEERFKKQQVLKDITRSAKTVYEHTKITNKFLNWIQRKHPEVFNEYMNQLWDNGRDEK